MQSIFLTTSNQIISLFLIMIIGFIIKKTGVVNDKMDKCVSQLLSYVIMPALVFQTFSNNFSFSILAEKSVIFLAGCVVIILSYILALFIAKPFSKEQYIRNIYVYSFAVVNFGYMGYSVIGGAFGEAQLFNMMIFCIPFKIFIYSIGMVILNPNNTKISLKGMVNPVSFAMILGAVVGLANIPVPEILSSTCSSVASCMSPMAMLIAGFVVAKYDIKELFGYKKVYVASLLRLVVIPALFLSVMKIMGVSQDILICTLGATAMALGLNTIIFPAAYGGDTKTGASMALISNIMGIVTIPLMFALFL